MRERIYITDADCDKLHRLIDGRRSAGSPDLEYLDMLELELDRAEIVPSGKIPRGVITMNSEVRLKDLDTGEEMVYRLIFPYQPRTEHTISVLAPIGTAMLGYRAGDVIQWRVPRGLRRLKVVEVACQPEAAALAS